MTRPDYYKKNFPQLVGFLEMSAPERLAYIKTPAGERWLSETLTPEELDAAVELICEAAAPKIRRKYPIIDSYLESLKPPLLELTEDMVLR